MNSGPQASLEPRTRIDGFLLQKLAPVNSSPNGQRAAIVATPFY
jgi:hypothetical protein